MSFNMRKAWNLASATYQQNQRIPVDSVYYGPWSPPESQLQLLGEIGGKKILEIGCGGGQSAIALARQGAEVTAIDVSDEQLQFARILAEKHHTQVHFMQGEVEHLPALQADSWDMLLSVNTFQYIADISRTLDACHRLLRTDGRLVISLDHPLRSCFIDEEDDELAIFPVRNYFDSTPMRWQFSDSHTWMVSYHRTLTAWVASLGKAGFSLLQLLEPPLVDEMADELWPLDGPHAALRNIPQTLILIAEKW